MKRSIFILFVLFFTASYLSIPSYTRAQLSIEPADIEVNVSPENPTPNQSVMVTIESYITDLDTAQITWSLNGEIMESGAGKKTLNFRTGNEGVVTNLSIIVITNKGQTVTKTIRLNPVYVDLLWESESYTPPFYRGKSLFSFQNRITFIAVPHIKGSGGAEISPKNLIYTWKKNGVVMDNESGFGKNTYLFIPTVIARPVEISVEVSSSNSTTKGVASISVSPTDPYIKFYEKNPIFGIQFQKALEGNVELKNSKEIAVVGIPYFFGTKNPYENLSYKWLINGSQIDADTSQIMRVFRQIEGVSGTSNISVSIGHNDKILQLANGSFNLKFSAPATEPSEF